ncbi:MAG: serine hydrolase domain-containing protein [Dysgonomonas sp.]|nr:serine hydrolase domain-containing protein [Dysgonomonas sp.]
MNNKLTATILFILPVFILFGFFSCGSKSHTESVLAKRVDSLLSFNEQKPFSGIVLIDRNDTIQYLKVTGYSDMEKKIPLDIDDQFVIGSISKQFTAVVVLQEYDKGNIDLSVPIRHYLPELKEKWADTINVHHLLTHTHGIVALDKPTLFEAGTQYDYSQIGYDLLAKVAEKTSGKSFAQLSSELFSLCGMENTFHPDIKEYKRLVKGYQEEDNGELVASSESLRQYPAAGAFISTAKDLLLWNNNFYGGKLLKDETFEMLTTKQKNAIRNHPIFGITEYGYGITVDDKQNIRQWGQTGYAPGFASMSFYFPETKTSAIVLENICYDMHDTKKTFFCHSTILDIVRKNIQENND